MRKCADMQMRIPIAIGSANYNYEIAIILRHLAFIIIFAHLRIYAFAHRYEILKHKQPF
jgi:hypothetical protein